MGYKLFQSKKWIFWDNPDMIDYPNFNIGDDYFEWVEVPTNNINFDTYKTGKITVKDKDITYFKLQKDNEQPTFWFVKNIDRILSNGYIYNIELDFYNTYTKLVLSRMITNNNIYPLIERTSWTSNMYFTNDQLTKIITYSVDSDDNLIDNLNLQIDNYEKIKYSIPNTETLRLVYKNTQGYDSFTDIIKSTTGSVDNYRYDISKGVYAVFINKNTKMYDLYPINNYIMNAYLNNKLTSLVNTYTYIASSLIDKDTENYGTSGFIGIFKGPIITGTYRHVVSNNRNFYCIELNPINKVSINFPFSFRFNQNDSFINFMVDLNTPLLWGKQEFKLKKYFKYFNKTNLDLNFSTYFADGFIASPKINVYSNDSDMIGFSGQLPSTSQDYLKQVVNAKATYDMGLSSLVTSTLGGVPNAIISGVANPILGAASGVSSITNLASSLIQQGMSYKRSLAGATPTYINSNTTDVFYINKYTTLFENDPIFSEKNQSCQLYEIAIKYNLTSYQKIQLRQIYHLYGYPCNLNVNLGLIYNNSNFNKRWYLKINDGWIRSNIRLICKDIELLKNESSDVLESIGNQISNGLRIWFQNSPDYYNYED